ncbi:BIG1 [Candida oxycetoniae]|uniref:Protein BIG1 n=1 Tax=Candida oxycetoniae TaxID=497107 RepID=A0AAI9T1V4_9ASCO|nr:BIG1 [Candida oxycetoniae]KAI3406781.2 BIG1 [Candida oxycetoniae]
MELELLYVKLLLIFTCVVPFVVCNLAPVLIASHRLVPDLSLEINDSNLLPHNASSVTNLLKKLVTQCSSDAYLVMDIPGLTFNDLTTGKKENWSFLRKYLYMASTIVGLPRVEDGLDLEFLEKYIIKTCDAETIHVKNGDPPTDYYDVRKRVIRINFNPLDTNTNRDGQLREDDALIRDILRQLPSPHYTIILTSSKPGFLHPTPKSIMKENPERFEIFNDIVNDPKHNGGVEKNDRFRKVEPNWNPVRDSNIRYIRNKKKDEIHLLDYDLWNKNEKLITTVFVMVLSLFSIKVFSIMSSLKQKIINWRSSQSGLLDKKVN